MFRGRLGLLSLSLILDRKLSLPFSVFVSGGLSRLLLVMLARVVYYRTDTVFIPFRVRIIIYKRSLAFLLDGRIMDKLGISERDLKPGNAVVDRLMRHTLNILIFHLAVTLVALLLFLGGGHNCWFVVEVELEKD